PTKCWLLRAGDNATDNAYAAWSHAMNEAYRIEGIKRRVEEVSDAEHVAISPTTNLKTAQWKYASNLTAAYSAEACHPFHVKAATQTGAKLPPIGA
ncbi:MAG: hypothetical protein ACK2U2_12740, partial [Anaerolineae bacterium]